MNRRTLIKTLAMVPLAGAALVKAMATPKKADDFKLIGIDRVKDPLPGNEFKLGQLYVMMGISPEADMRLARDFAHRQGFVVFTGFQNMTDPWADCAYVTSRGTDVLLIVPTSSSDKFHLGFGGSLSTLPHYFEMAQADWVFFVDGWSVETNTETGRKRELWTVRTLKDRQGTRPEKFRWIRDSIWSEDRIVMLTAEGGDPWR